jgi:fused signal recognition particle receptor
LNIYFVVGVNGAGKTTMIGKLAHKFKQENNKVLLVAGDTFRAAAEEQLDIWAKRSDVDIVREDKADSASLVYKAIDKARNENYNVIIVDSAGRLQNKFNLIEELKKIKNVIAKKLNDDNLETILVLDGTQGQNGLSQASVFNEAVDITSLAITKMDSTSKGGIIFAIAKELKLPCKIIGIGEKIDDIAEFNSSDFIDAIFN